LEVGSGLWRGHSWLQRRDSSRRFVGRRSLLSTPPPNSRTIIVLARSIPEDASSHSLPRLGCSCRRSSDLGSNSSERGSARDAQLPHLPSGRLRRIDQTLSRGLLVPRIQRTA